VGEGIHDAQQTWAVFKMDTTISTVSRIKKIATRICIVVTIVVIQLVALEFVTFAIHRFLSSRPNTSYLASSVYAGKDWADRHWYEMNAVELGYHAYVIWRLKPFSGDTINVDHNGIRLTSPNHCDTGSYTIFMFGGSTLWGSGAPDGETIPSELAKLYERDGRSVCVVNFGQSAWVSTQEVIKLILELKHNNRKPNLVVFYDGVNDTLVPYQSGRVDRHLEFNWVKSLFENERNFRNGTFRYLLKTNTAGFLRRLAVKLGMQKVDAVGSREGLQDVDAMAQKTTLNYLQNIDLVQMLSEKYDFDYTFFWQPVLFVSNKVLTDEEERIRAEEVRTSPGLEAFFQKTYRIIQSQNHANLYYIADAFDQYSESIYIDSHHVSTKGNIVIAQRIYDILKNRVFKSMSYRN
jgi:lysophospholipase L1-like esterase